MNILTLPILLDVAVAAVLLIFIILNGKRGLVLSLVGSLGAILCGVGVFLTLPIAFIGFYHMARQITDGGPLAITRA